MTQHTFEKSAKSTSPKFKGTAIDSSGRSRRSGLRPIGLLTLTLALAAAIGSLAVAQLPPVNGMRPTDLRAHAITDATVIPAPGQKIEHATIIIRNGLIEAVGPKDSIEIPADAWIWPAEGKTVYAGLIEPALMIRAEVKRGAGSHWNSRIHPEVNMAEQPAPDAALRKELRAMGFTAAAVYPSHGAIRGKGAFIALAEDNEHVLLYRDHLPMAMAFDYGGGGPRRGGGEAADPNISAYPGSLMGAQALIRQTLHDADWHRNSQLVWSNHPEVSEPPLRADALEALGSVLSHYQQILFDAPDELNALRAVNLLKEFNFQSLILLGSGLEFRQLREILALKVPLIVPLNFPARPDVSSLWAADSVSLRDMMTWEQAPTNPRRLINGGATVALTTHRLRNRNEFFANLRSAIKHGLTEDQALAAMTTEPAKLMHSDQIMGTIEPGKVANLVVVKGSLFDKDAKVYETWVNGRRYEINSDAMVQVKGSGTLTIEKGGTGAEDAAARKEFKVDVDTLKSSVSLHLPENKKAAAKKVVVQQDQISFVLDGKPLDAEGYVRFSGVIEGKTITGSGAMPDGSIFAFEIEISEQRDAANEQAADKTEKPEQDAETKPDADDDAAEQPAQSPDPVSGDWRITLEQMHEGEPISMALKLEESNRVSGVVSVAGQTFDFNDGRFDPATGKLTFSVTSPEGAPGNVEATVTGNNVAGTYVSEQLNTKFAGTREVAARPGRRGERDGAKKEEEKFVMPPEELNYPLGEYGLPAPPQAEDFIIVNATIWTCGPEGILQRGWMRVRNGKIAAIGSGVQPRWNEQPAQIVDLDGKHITPGLIDCHSHTGITGSVNEMAQTNTAECRIADCIDPTDINWYRQLAGGLTAANQLHGSANPIGGQNSVVKLKFGAAGGADAFPIRDAIPGIKFALGENVKRSTGRYPNTRMGVETFIRDAFTAAKEYKAKWARYDALTTEQKARTMPPQRDLELDALVQILDKQRLVHCHSYRQDEILMLIRVADHFGFTIGTFQHVLEGFKVADAIGKHGAGASSFSDWWAYKMEVMDAIPYNGSLMRDVGVLVSFNSDSDELARRMNTEAAKAVRYGGCEPHEALKFVTINPARQLRIDKRVGSLEQGKDADFVIWSGDPLSTYTRCEQTWIEGAKYFDIETDRQLRGQIHAERQRLIQKILAQAHGEAGKSGGDAVPGEGRPGGTPGADRPRRRPPQEVIAWLEEQVRMGRDPEEARPGVCGCDHSHEFAHE